MTIIEESSTLARNGSDVLDLDPPTVPLETIDLTGRYSFWADPIYTDRRRTGTKPSVAPGTADRTVSRPASPHPGSDEVGQTEPEAPRDEDAVAEPEPTSEASTSVDRRHAGDLQLRHVRLTSVATVAGAFALVGFVVTMATLVLCWTVIDSLGYVTTVEELARTSLGLDAFEIAGRDLFDLTAVVTGAGFALAFVIALLLGLVYNAVGTVFGGLTFEARRREHHSVLARLRHG